VSKLFVIGLSHRTAPLTLRESLAVPDSELRDRLTRAAALCGEALLLSTCNRVELYGSLRDEAALGELRGLLTQTQPEAARHLYEKQGEEAVGHLFRVAASLDSLVIGEPQILGQLKQAYRSAQEIGTVGPVLGALLPKAFAVAKRVRSETAIGQNPASVASVAVQLAHQVFGSLHKQPVLLVGAGKMAELVARHLLQAEVSPLWIVNRTLGRAESLAAELGGEAQSFDRLESLLTRAAVVISSTGARDPVIRAELMSRVMKARRGRWLLLVDIAVPRDIESQVGQLENVYLYDLDALQQVVSHGQAERQREAESAHHIVVEELARQGRRARSADVSPVIRALRSQAHELAQAEVARVLPKLSALTDRQKQLVAGLGPSIVNKLLHLPLTALRQQAEQSGGAEGAGELADAIVRLWSLDKLLGTVAEPIDELPSGPVETQAGPSPRNAKDLENSSS